MHIVGGNTVKEYQIGQVKHPFRFCAILLTVYAEAGLSATAQAEQIAKLLNIMK